MSEVLWGVDLGGTKIEGVVMDGSPSDTRCRLRVSTEAGQGYDHILRRIAELVDAMARETGERPHRIGMGTPGALNPVTGQLRNSNTACLIGKPLMTDLEALLCVEIRMANDANCFALAEAAFGAAAGARIAFGMILGTGVGGGVVIEGKVLGGAQGIAGEWGHNQLDPLGEPCYCGKRGCVETVISGPALERFYRDRCGRSKPLRDIVALAKVGKDADAAATIERLAESFGKALSVVVNILDPDVVVVGGGVGNVEAIYSAGVESLRRHVFNDELLTKVRRPKLGDSAGVYGAALLAR